MTAIGSAWSDSQAVIALSGSGFMYVSITGNEWMLLTTLTLECQVHFLLEQRTKVYG